LTAFLRYFIFEVLAIWSTPPNVIIRRYYAANRGPFHVNCRVWNTLARNPENFWFSTGQTPGSLSSVVERVRDQIESRVRDRIHARLRLRRTRPNTLCTSERVLMAFIWLRQYPTFSSLGSCFGVAASYVCDNLYIIMPILHEHYVHRYISWHDEGRWNGQRGEFDELI
jgi:hypothetical protein